MKLIHVVGTRPNFMKIAPIMREASKYESIEQVLIHTGQHYDENMSEWFFRELGIPLPDVNLGVGSGPHGKQTSEIMKRFEEFLKLTVDDDFKWKDERWEADFYLEKSKQEEEKSSRKKR